MSATDWYGVTFLALILGVVLNAAYTALIASRTTRVVGQLHRRISELEENFDTYSAIASINAVHLPEPDAEPNPR